MLLLVLATEVLGVLATSVVGTEVILDVVAIVGVGTDEISAVDSVTSAFVLDQGAQLSLLCSFW